MTPIHRHKKPKSGSPSQHGQCDIAAQDPRCDSSGYDATINQPQHTYIRHHHLNTTTPSHCKNKPNSGSPNQRFRLKIVYRDPSHDNSDSDAKIKGRRNISGSDDNGHYHEGHFWHSHSIHKLRHHKYHDSCQPDNINDEETVKAGWSVGKINHPKFPRCLIDN